MVTNHAKGKQVEVIGHKQPNIIYNKNKLMAYIKINGFMTVNITVKSFNEETTTLVSETYNSNITVDMKAYSLL